MIKSYRTKRRKIQNDLRLLNCYESDSGLINYNQQSSQNKIKPLVVQLNLLTGSNTNINFNDPLNIPVLNNVSVTSSLSRPISNIEDISSNESESILNNNDVNNFNITIDNKESLNIKLKNWALECNVPHSMLDKLLLIIKKRRRLNIVPKITFK